MAADIPPILIEFKGDIKGIKDALVKVQNDLEKFNKHTKDSAHAAKDMSAKTVAAGAVMASVFQKVAGAAFKFAKQTIGAFGDVAGEVRKLQRVIGGTAEDVSRLRFAGEELGVSNDKLIMGFKILSTHLAKNDEAAKQLGIEYRDSRGNLLPMTDIVSNLSERFKDMPAGVNRTALATAAFGRSGINMLPILAKGKEGLKGLYDESNKLGLTMSGKDLEAAKKFTLQQRYLHAAVTGAQVAIGRVLMPVMIRMADYIKETIVPKLQEFVNGLTGKNSLGGALTNTASTAHKWGERIRGLIKFVKDFRYWIGLLGITLGVVFAATKIITYVDSVVTAFATLRAALLLLRASWLGVAAASAAAAIAEAFATWGANIAAGAAALAVAGAALFGIYAYKENNKEPERTDPRQGQGYTDSLLAVGAAQGLKAPKKPAKPKKPKDEYDPFASSGDQTLAQSLLEKVKQAKATARLKMMGASAGLIEAIMGSADWAKEYAKIKVGGKVALRSLQNLYNQTEDGHKEIAAAAAAKFAKTHKGYIDTIKQSMIKTQRQFDVAFSGEITTKGKLKTTREYLKDLKPIITAAREEEVATRGTTAHTAAQATLNKVLGEQAKAQKIVNRLMNEATDKAKEHAKATAEINRQQTMLNTTMTASNSWLASQVRTAGVTAAQQNSFVEVPVIIDGQTLFRVVQKHSLVNDRRNVSNGLARSGSTIG